MRRSLLQKNAKLFSLWMLLLCAFGLILNLTLSKLVIVLGLPMYVDNAGSILVGILGGALPGITVGFLSNMIGSASTPIYMYYSVFTIIIAWLASVYSQKGLLKRWTGWLMATASFVLVGGAVGSVMGWFLNGQVISGLAEPVAGVLAEHGIAPMAAQLMGDVLIDIPDKLMTMAIVWLLLRLVSKKLPGRFPCSYLYDGSQSNDDAVSAVNPMGMRGKKTVQKILPESLRRPLFLWVCFLL